MAPRSREMHDVLAHRISLIAMNARALNYRQDLPPGQVREIAATLRDNADQTVTELREVLGVLRGGEGPGQPRGPQPDLHHLADLLAEASDSGPPVVSNLRVDTALVPETISRHAYRIIQEGLTNARKHAPGQPVTVALSGGAGVGLDLTVVNQPRQYGRTPSEAAVRDSGSGLGCWGWPSGRRSAVDNSATALTAPGGSSCGRGYRGPREQRRPSHPSPPRRR